MRGGRTSSFAPRSTGGHDEDSQSDVHADVERRIQAASGAGSPLPANVQAFMAPRFDADFSRVRVHAGSHATALNRDLSARAFTYGSDIYFGDGRAAANDTLTAHELAHVVQQTGASAASSVIRRQTAGEASGGESSQADGPETIVSKGAAAIEQQGGTPSFLYFAANREASLFFVMFEDFDVNRLYWHLINEWLGASGVAESLTDAAISETPRWVGEFRAKALNLRARKPAAVDAEYTREQQLGALAVKLADSVAAETPGQKVRRQFVQAVDKRIGTIVMTQEAIDAERKKPAEGGLTPSNFTTCIAFFGQVTDAVRIEAGIEGPLLHGPNYYKEIDKVNGKETLPPGAWHVCTPTTRPKPGDLIILNFAKDETSSAGVFLGKGYFAHISILRSIEKVADGDAAAKGAAERWISVDGGGTTATEVVRYFFPDTCGINGPGAVVRTLRGWIDIEKAAEAKLVKKPAP